MNKLLMAAGLALLFATPVSAATDAKRSEAVSHADLDLATMAGRAKLDQRLRSAARRVCGATEINDLYAHMNERRCFKTALLGARERAALAVLKREKNVRLATR